MLLDNALHFQGSREGANSRASKASHPSRPRTPTECGSSAQEAPPPLPPPLPREILDSVATSLRSCHVTNTHSLDSNRSLHCQQTKSSMSSSCLGRSSSYTEANAQETSSDLRPPINCSYPLPNRSLSQQHLPSQGHRDCSACLPPVVSSTLKPSIVSVQAKEGINHYNNSVSIEQCQRLPVTQYSASDVSVGSCHTERGVTSLPSGKSTTKPSYCFHHSSLSSGASSLTPRCTISSNELSTFSNNNLPSPIRLPNTDVQGLTAAASDCFHCISNSSLHSQSSQAKNSVCARNSPCVGENSLSSQASVNIRDFVSRAASGLCCEKPLQTFGETLVANSSTPCNKQTTTNSASSSSSSLQQHR